MDPKKIRTYIIYIAFAMVLIALVLYLTVGRASQNSAVYGTYVGPAELSALYALSHNTTLANADGTSLYSGLNLSSYFRHVSNNLTAPSVPTLTYVGAEYCPYCATARWGLILAMMRFGNFTGIEYMASSPTDVYADTPTFSFVNASYSSKYFKFVSYEIETRNETALQKPNGTALALFDTYSNGIPFLAFDNNIVADGTLIDPTILDGHNWGAITSSAAVKNTTISDAVIGAANIYTAEICNMINNTDTNVCAQSYVKSVQSKMAQ
jgi:hypothetical protein